MNDRPIDPHHRPELIDPSAFVADNATVVGNVRIENKSSVWFGALVRGDTESIEIGENSNVQDLSVLHADPGFLCRIGKGVTIGHGAVVHGAIVGDGALIGTALPDAPVRVRGRDTWMVSAAQGAFTLLALGDVTVPQGHGIDVMTFDMAADPHGHLRERYGWDRAVLLRPDGHICAVFDAPDLADIKAAHARAMGTKT